MTRHIGDQGELCRTVNIRLERDRSSRRPELLVGDLLHETIHAYLFLWECRHCCRLFSNHGKYLHADAWQIVAGIIAQVMERYFQRYFKKYISIGRRIGLAMEIAETGMRTPPASAFERWDMDPSALNEMLDLARVRVRKRKHAEAQEQNRILLEQQKEQADTFLLAQGKMFQEQMPAKTTPAMVARNQEIVAQQKAQAYQHEELRRRCHNAQTNQALGRSMLLRWPSRIRGRSADENRDGGRSTVRRESRQRRTSVERGTRYEGRSRSCM